MFYRFTTVTGSINRGRARYTASHAVAASTTLSRFLRTMHYLLTALGIGAIAAWGILFFNPELAGYLTAYSPFDDATEETVVVAPPLHQLMEAPAVVPVVAAATTLASVPAGLPVASNNNSAATEREREWVTKWLSKRYRVAGDATNMFVTAAYATAHELKLDPLLILAVMAIESRFNPFAESPVGAQGLMQVMSKVHKDKFRELGGTQAALNPMANIRVGSQILKEYVTRGGSVEAGLKMYVGAAALDTDFGYGAKVLAEYRKLKDVSAGKKVSIYSATASTKPKRQPSSDIASDTSAGTPAQIKTAADQPTPSATEPLQVSTL